MTNTGSVPYVTLVQKPRTAGRQSARQRLRCIMTGDSSVFTSVGV